METPHQRAPSDLPKRETPAKLRTEDRTAGRRGPVFTSGEEFLAVLRETAAADRASDSSMR